MKKALLGFWREAVPVLKYMSIVTLLIVIVAGCSVSSTFAKWAGIITGSLIAVSLLVIFILHLATLNVKSREESVKDDTPEKRAKARKEVQSGWGSFFKFLLITLGFIVGGLILLAVPVLIFMFLFPTYGMMVTAFSVIVVIGVLIWLFFLAKNGGDLTNTFWW